MPGSDIVRSPWCKGVLRRFSRVLAPELILPGAFPASAGPSRTSRARGQASADNRAKCHFAVGSGLLHSQPRSMKALLRTKRTTSCQPLRLRSGHALLLIAALAGSTLASPAVGASLEATLTLDPSQPGAAISPYLYGQFIEHLGRCIHDGVWAEKLRDRKFFQPLDKSPGRWSAPPTRSSTLTSILPAPSRASIAWRFGVGTRTAATVAWRRRTSASSPARTMSAMPG